MVAATPIRGEKVLRLTGITKSFGSVVANRDVSLELARGEILALLGENGAGKSTLMSILFGHYTADSGGIEAFGRPLAPGRPRAALEAGIGIVHQHFTLADNLTALDNILLGTEPLWSPRSRRAAARARVVELAGRFGLAVDPDRRIGDLSVGERQRVEILKAVYRDAHILILDEPTAVLTPLEIDPLFDTLRRMASEGRSVIFISHKLSEVLALSDRVVVLRRGEKVADIPTAGASASMLSDAMIGRTLAKTSREPQVGVGEPAREAQRPILVLDGVGASPARRGPRLADVSLEVRPGEIVAIAGIAGNAQETLADLVCGMCPPASGLALFDGRPLPDSPRGAVRAGIGRIPEDRRSRGVIASLPLWENAVLETYWTARFARWGLRRPAAARRHAAAVVRDYDVKPADVAALAGTLSGGNQQKLILGRVLSESPRLIVASQPTWGLDIGAVAFVHARLLEARDRGAGVLLISEDLDEIFALADRIAVIQGGRLSAVRAAGDWTLAAIGQAMAGAGPAPAAS
jgi:simple sugar transport system ATP-binding protein